MYPWVTHMHSVLGGECQHKCSYCYVKKLGRKRDPRFSGNIRLLKEEMNVNYGTGKTIFIEHLNDLFSYSVPDQIIFQILEHCRRYPNNKYIFQTKNPERYSKIPLSLFPPKYILGMTIETNREIPGISFAPKPFFRFSAATCLDLAIPFFITIEPIMDFDLNEFSTWIYTLKPDFVNIGADSKGHNLPEPTAEKVESFIKVLEDNEIEIREKHNLERIMKR